MEDADRKVQRPGVVVAQQPPPPFNLPGLLSHERRPALPGQDVFQSQGEMSQAPTGPLASYSLTTPPPRGFNPYQRHYQPSHTHPSYPMAPTIPRPENLPTPSKHSHSAPRTPDPATMRGGAFAGMTLDNSIPITPQHIGPNPLAPVRMDEMASDHGFKPKFERLFLMAEKYCYTHMNFPSSAKDSQLPAAIKERLMKAATRESAHQLGSTGTTRYFLMTKIVLQWIVKHVFKQSLFTNFDLDADRRIVAYKDNIYQDTPPLVKFQLLSQIGREIQQIREHPNFPHFLETLVRNQVSKLWAIVRPLMHHTTHMDWEDLRILMYEAYSVAGDMAASPYEWRFEFAQIGSNYDSRMINRDPYLRGHEDDLARRGLCVRLGFAPAVHLRDNSGGVVKTGQVMHPQVLLKPLL